jgi:hypothetical protein
VTKKDCLFCRDDFYNHNRMGLNEERGEPECWCFKTATMEYAIDVPIDMRPPYLALKETKRPSCYKRQGEVRVKKSNLTKEGYWM